MNGFQGSRYIGLEARPDPDDINVQFFLGLSGRILHLKTYFAYPEALELPLVRVSWHDSIECISFAEHVSGHTLTTIGEELLAKMWQGKGSYNNIYWRKGSEVVKPDLAEDSNNYIIMAAGKEALRFF